MPVMDIKNHYDHEERFGRRRKYREVFESDPNIIDFELHILPYAYEVGGEKFLKQVYSHYLRKGYDYLGK